MPLPGATRRGASRRQSPEEARSANQDLAGFAAWAQMQQVQQGGGG